MGQFAPILFPLRVRGGDIFVDRVGDEMPTLEWIRGIDLVAFCFAFHSVRPGHLDAVQALSVSTGDGVFLVIHCRRISVYDVHGDGGCPYVFYEILRGQRECRCPVPVFLRRSG